MRIDKVFYGLLVFNMFVISWNGRSSGTAESAWMVVLSAACVVPVAAESIWLIHGHVQRAYTRGNTDGFREGIDVARGAQREREAREEG